MNTTLNPIEQPARSPYSARNMAKSVSFFYKNPGAHSVSLLGDFNGWNPDSHPMRRQPDGGWFLQVPMTHGHHRYLFLVDGVSILDPRATGITRLQDFSCLSSP